VKLDGVYKGIDFLLNVNLGIGSHRQKGTRHWWRQCAMDVARSAAREVLRQHAACRNFEPSQGNMEQLLPRDDDVSLLAAWRAKSASRLP